MIRQVKRVVTGTAQTDGAGVKLVRVLGHSTVEAFDPFLMLDAFDSTDPADYIKGFPWHPHRGIETVTYLVSGIVEHGDSIGNSGTINDGCCQWMTAGSGILHQEMPKASPRMLGVQLWLNLPRAQKMTVPQYRDITAESIPEVASEGARTRVISGRYDAFPGPVSGDYVPMRFFDVALEPETSWQVGTDPDHTVFVYIMAGDGRFGGSDGPQNRRGEAVLFGDGSQVSATAGAEGIRFLFFSGPPLKEPIAWGGPIVMNTREELELAFKEFHEGTFIK